MHSYPVAFICTLILLWFLIPFARHIGLTDKPAGRKQHTGEIPLIGGVAMFTAFLLAVLTLPNLPDDMHSFLFAAIALTAVGVLDDFHETGVRTRLFVQLFAALIMTSTAGHVVNNIGDLINKGDVILGDWAIPFSVFAVIGVINALNMADGIDGLAGSVSLISFVSMYYLAEEAGRPEASMVLLFIFVLIPFLFFNIPFFGKVRAYVFMGDAGSLFLGLGLAWYFIVLCQGENAAMSPITALWIFSIPLFDTVSIMFRRILKGHSPFRPDRDHFHHVFQAAGYSNRKTLVIIVITQLIMALIGIVGYKLGMPDWVMFWSYMLLLGLFFWTLKRAWYVMRVLRQIGGGTT